MSRARRRLRTEAWEALTLPERCEALAQARDDGIEAAADAIDTGRNPPAWSAGPYSRLDPADPRRVAYRRARREGSSD